MFWLSMVTRIAAKTSTTVMRKKTTTHAVGTLFRAVATDEG
jgi:hypothetical protein